MRLYRRLLVALFCVVSVVGLFRARAQEPAQPPPSVVAPPVRSDERPVTIQKLEDAEKVLDPRALVRAADFHRATNPDLARALHERALEVSEFSQYFRGGKDLKSALIAERMGDLDGAAAIWRAQATRDPLDTVLALRNASIHPDRDALVEEALAHVRRQAEKAKNGAKDAVIYVTKKGEPRNLEYLPGDEWLTRMRAWAAGDESKALKYCYVEAVDLSAVEPTDIPEKIQFQQCVIGTVRIPSRAIGKLVLNGFILGDLDVGKTWEGEVNKSKTVAASTFGEIVARETVFLGRANFQDVLVTGRKADFPFAIFEGPADFRGANFSGRADFRFSVFGENANFKRARFEKYVYFGNTRYRARTTFTQVYAGREVYFDSARFEGPVLFDRCERTHPATFENTTFQGPAEFSAMKVDGRLNMSRTRILDRLEMKEVAFGGMDFIGAEIAGDASFVDARFDGKVRFSLDDVTRARYLEDPGPLLPLYRDYQGDEDRDEPLTATNSYGVEHVDDLIARIDGNISFANSVFRGFCIFERVSFGRPGGDKVAEFYNTQFGGETHFERTTWHSSADFSTIYAEELALNEATIHRTLVLDDANVPGRVILTDAAFTGDATLSFYGAQIGTFQVDRDQITDEERGVHRLWYDQCANARMDPSKDLRVRRQFRGTTFDADAFRETCYDRATDEFVSLKGAWGDEAMTAEEDWAYWWIKHYETVAGLKYGGIAGILAFPVKYLLFEQAFGWGVRLGNLAVTALLVCAFFSLVYRRFCPDTEMSYNGDPTPIREIPWHGLFYISLQSLGAFNTGWDFGKSDPAFRYLNTVHTYTGVIIMTFFVGAYTRMILA
jgi:uncharacterized protein YjbI with pentapeptide repeats